MGQLLSSSARLPLTLLTVTDRGAALSKSLHRSRCVCVLEGCEEEPNLHLYSVEALCVCVGVLPGTPAVMFSLWQVFLCNGGGGKHVVTPDMYNTLMGIWTNVTLVQMCCCLITAQCEKNN